MATTDADSANSAASGLLKNRFSYHDARYNDLARWNGSGLCRDATVPRNSLVGLIDTITASARIFFSRSCHPHRTGRAACLENHARRTGSTLPETLLHAKAAHLQLARRHLCMAALGARNVKTASWKKVLKFARSRLSATTCRASAALLRLRLTCLPPWQLRIPKASVSQYR